MDALSVASQVIRGVTGEDVVMAKRLTNKDVLQDFEVTTETGRIFTVTVNTYTIHPVGHFFEGRDPTRAKLTNYTLEGGTKLVLE